MTPNRICIWFFRKNIYIFPFWQVFRLDERKIQNVNLPRQNGNLPGQNGNLPRQNGNFYGKIPIFWIDWQRKPYALEKLIFKRKKPIDFILVLLSSCSQYCISIRADICCCFIVVHQWNCLLIEDSFRTGYRYGM